MYMMDRHSFLNNDYPPREVIVDGDAVMVPHGAVWSKDLKRFIDSGIYVRNPNSIGLIECAYCGNVRLSSSLKECPTCGAPGRR
jgi:hypothetical protein